MWINEDGLPIKFGTEKGVNLVAAGDYKTFNRGESVLEFEINLTKLTEAETILNDNIFLGAGSQIVWVETVAEVAGDTGAAIDVGLVYQHATTHAITELDYDGLLAAAPLTAQYDAAGDTVTFYENTTVPASMTGTGVLVGTVLATTASKYYVTASRTTGTAFTAGVLKVRIGYIPNALKNVDGI